MVDNVHLSLENEAELRTIKLFTSGAFKDMALPGANGFDITNLLILCLKIMLTKLKVLFLKNLRSY